MVLFYAHKANQMGKIDSQALKEREKFTITISCCAGDDFSETFIRRSALFCLLFRSFLTALYSISSVSLGS